MVVGGEGEGLLPADPARPLQGGAVFRRDIGQSGAGQGGAGQGLGAVLQKPAGLAHVRPLGQKAHAVSRPQDAADQVTLLLQ